MWDWIVYKEWKGRQTDQVVGDFWHRKKATFQILLELPDVLIGRACDVFYSVYFMILCMCVIITSRWANNLPCALCRK